MDVELGLLPSVIVLFFGVVCDSCILESHVNVCVGVKIWRAPCTYVRKQLLVCWKEGWGKKNSLRENDPLGKALESVLFEEIAVAEDRK